MPAAAKRSHPITKRISPTARSAAEAGHGRRSFLSSIDGKKPQPITPEGTFGNLVTPDGKFLLAIDGNRQRWYLFASSAFSKRL